MSGFLESYHLILVGSRNPLFKNAKDLKPVLNSGDFDLLQMRTLQHGDISLSMDYVIDPAI